MNTILSHTESVCPECLARIPAARVMYDGGDVYLEKDCPDHGHFKTIIWRGLPAFTSWVKPKIPPTPKIHLPKSSADVRMIAVYAPSISSNLAACCSK